MSETERKATLLIAINNEYVKAATAEQGSAEQLLHEKEYRNLLKQANYTFGVDFKELCENFLDTVDVAIALWREGNL